MADEGTSIRCPHQTNLAYCPRELLTRMNVPRSRQSSLWALTLGALVRAADSLADTPPRVVYVPDISVENLVGTNENASVLLEITVTETGTVGDPVIREGLNRETDLRVLDAVNQMRFTPAERDGQPVRARVRFRFRVRHVSAPTTSTTPATAQTSTTTPTTTENQSTSTTPRNTTAAAGLPRPRPRATPRNEDGEQVVTVRGLRPEPGAATREILRAEELTSVPGTFGEPLRVIASLPGVGRSPLGVGFFLVRGASFENTGFIVDGFPVLNLYHFGAGPSVIASPFVSSLEFEPGNYPLAFGRFSAGLIQVRTDVPRPRAPRVIAEVDLLRASAFAALPVGRTGSISFAVRRSYYDPFLAIITPGVYVGFADAQFRYEVDLFERTRLTWFTFASTDRFTVGPQGAFVASPYRSGLDYSFWRSIARLEYRPSQDVRVEYAGMIGWDRVDVLSNRRVSTQIPGGPTRTNETATLQGNVFGQRLTARAKLSPTHAIHVGLDTLAQEYRVVTSLRSNTVDATELTQINAALFAEHVLSLSPVELVTGLRVDYARYAEYQRFLMEPRFLARIKAHRMLTIVGATGLFHQLPNALLMVSGFALPPQRAWQNSVGFELDVGALFDARVTGYYNHLFDLPAFGGIAPSIGDPVESGDIGVDSTSLFSTQGRAYGLELFLRRRLERGIFGWISYTLSRSERVKSNGNVSLFNYDQTHVFNVALSWKINDRWRVGARFQFASGSPTANLIGAGFDTDSREYTPLTSADMLARNPSSNQLDVRVDYTFRVWRLKMNAFLDVINIYNAQNGDLGWTYRYDYSQRVPGGGIPILPTIGLRAEL